MRIPGIVKWQLKDVAKHILLVWAVSVLVHQSLEWYGLHQQKIEIEALAAEDFDDYMKYYSIFPPAIRVGYGDVVRHVSDSEVKKGGFWIEWEETIECDHNPYDGNEVYEWYATVKNTGRNLAKPRARSSAEVLKKKKGYVALHRDTDTKIRYPNHDADCRIESIMTQHHPHGIRKIQTMYGIPAKVRGFHGQTP